VPVSEGFAAKLAERRGLTPAQIRTAVRFARLAQPHDAADADASSLEGADRAPARQRRQGPGRCTGRARRARGGHSYDLSLLNVESRFEVPRIVEALKRRGHGTLCFHGAPGTGKTALAEHIAQALQRPLMIRQTSDIASKYVGETEQNMARMFEEAQNESAVLLLDEADSFLRSRRMAERNYEVTEVNQMLQGMERFAGVFICTTNLFRGPGRSGAAALHLQGALPPADARAAPAHVRGRGPGGQADR
jgi:hypothetical protein